MKVFKVTYEVVHYPGGVPLPIFFHPVYHVEARSVEEAVERAGIAFDSHEENKKLKREIVKLESVTRPDDEDLILKLEDK